MTYFLIGLATLLVAVSIYCVSRKITAVRVARASANFVKLGLLARLERVYANALDAEQAVLLARAVVSYIFCDQDLEEDAMRYQQENIPLIEREAKRLAADRYICRLVTRAVRMDSRVNGAGTTAAEVRLRRLEELGLYEKPVTPLPLRGFSRLARTFYEECASAPDPVV